MGWMWWRRYDLLFQTELVSSETQFQPSGLDGVSPHLAGLERQLAPFQMVIRPYRDGSNPKKFLSGWKMEARQFLQALAPVGVFM